MDEVFVHQCSTQFNFIIPFNISNISKTKTLIIFVYKPLSFTAQFPLCICALKVDSISSFFLNIETSSNIYDFIRINICAK